MRRAEKGARCAALGLAILLTACSENLTAPGSCPDFCSPSALSLIDTVLPAAIGQDSTFGRPVGYANPYNSVALLAVSVAGRESRPIFRTIPVPARLVVGTDTTTGAVTGVDSVRLSLTITRRDTAAHNLTLSLYTLPLALDSTTAFHDLDGPFAAAPVRSLNVDSLLAKPGLRDPATRDSAIVDTVNHRITLLIGLDSAQVPFVSADSGKLALGIRVSADSRASVALGSLENTGLGPLVTWFLKVDSLGLAVAHRSRLAQPSFDSFVFDPPAQPLGSVLVVGGVPAARIILRMDLPRVIHDSSRVVRATLEFVAAAQLEGSAADSFPVVAAPVIADFGAKSPLSAANVDTTWISIAPIDTVRIDVTSVLAFWASDSVAPTTLALRQAPEGAEFAELRLHSSADVGQRPTRTSPTRRATPSSFARSTVPLCSPASCSPQRAQPGPRIRNSGSAGSARPGAGKALAPARRAARSRPSMPPRRFRTRRWRTSACSPRRRLGPRPTGR